MANTLLTPQMIAKEAVMQFKNQLVFTRGINKQYSDEFARTGAKVGQTISVRKPWRPSVTTGATLVAQDILEESTSLTVNNQKHVGFTFATSDLALTVDKFSERYIKPSMAALANQVDIDMQTLAYQSTYNIVGSNTNGSNPDTLPLYLQAAQKLNEFGAPGGDRNVVMSPAAQTSIVGALTGLFNPSQQISRQYEKGVMGTAAGADWSMSQNVVSHTVGPQGGTPLVNTASQTGAVLITDGWTAAVANRVKKGDVFTVAGVYAVNPITKQSTGSLQQFVVTADTSSDVAGNVTIPISPSIITSGPTQTVTASPADNAAITMVGSAGAVANQNLYYHKDAFTLACVDLEMPEGVHFAARASDPDSGLSLRIVRAYDISADKIPCRIDILYGNAALRPEWSCRVTK